MCLLVEGDIFQVVVVLFAFVSGDGAKGSRSTYSCAIASIGEALCAEVRNSSLVEDIFEMLQSQCELEYVNIDVLLLLDWGGACKANQRGGGEAAGQLHIERMKSEGGRKVRSTNRM
jgi:hypothetical protein